MRINSIYRIFVLFLIIIVGSFLILYWYSSANLKVSLQRVAKIQMEYSAAAGGYCRSRRYLQLCDESKNDAADFSGKTENKFRNGGVCIVLAQNTKNGF